MSTTSPAGAADDPAGDTSRALELLRLVLRCADCVSTDNLTGAADLLPALAALSSPFGSPADRVAAYFSDALRHRVFFSLLSIVPPNGVLDSLTLSATHLRRFHGALQLYNSITPLIKFSHFTANQAIYEALDGEDLIHVIDLDIMQGLQWPGLFHILASRSNRPSSIRVTGFGPSMDLLLQTGRRLAEFATSLSLPFEFFPLEGKIGNLADPARLRVDPSEAIVVHCMHHWLYDITGSDLGTLKALKSIKPKVITMVEQDLTKTTSFLARFVDALHYYSALFDAVGEGLEKECIQRHIIEQELLGCEIRNILAVGGCKRRMDGGDFESVGRWGDELGQVGFCPFSLAGSPAAQAGLLLGMGPWKGYTLVEENGRLKLGWKDLSLLTASAWELGVQVRARELAHRKV